MKEENSKSDSENLSEHSELKNLNLFRISIIERNLNLLSESDLSMVPYDQKKLSNILEDF